MTSTYNTRQRRQHGETSEADAEHADEQPQVARQNTDLSDNDIPEWFDEPEEDVENTPPSTSRSIQGIDSTP